MSESGTFLEYRGPLDFAVIDSLLIKLKKTREFAVLNKTTGKRVYSMVVECLENILKHTELNLLNNPAMYSNISVGKENDKIIIKAGNPVTDDAKDNIASRLDHLNKSDEVALKALYENKIKSNLNSDDICAGLGFIYIALKSGNKIIYSFNPLTNGYIYFEIQITLNKYIMRKLIIEQKASSPKVILDPEKRIFLISGESRPPDVREFYGQILEWLEEFSSHLNKSDDKKDPVIFNFNFEYFNSSSGKLILDICKILAGLRLKGINIIVKWYYEKEDGDMLEVGKEMSRIVKFPFEYVESELNQ
jgi:SAM-dependent methyltransferase